MILLRINHSCLKNDLSEIIQGAERFYIKTHQSNQGNMERKNRNAKDSLVLYIKNHDFNKQTGEKGFTKKITDRN